MEIFQGGPLKEKPKTILLPVDLILPTQVDDGQQSFTPDDPITVYGYGDYYMIRHGNHRYYRGVESGDRFLKCIIQPYDPYHDMPFTKSL